MTKILRHSSPRCVFNEEKPLHHFEHDDDSDPLVPDMPDVL